MSRRDSVRVRTAALLVLAREDSLSATSSMNWPPEYIAARCGSSTFGFRHRQRREPAGGNGITLRIATELFAAGGRQCRSGDHLWDEKEVLELLENEKRF